jgi:CNT family concentrative nucleoside transporter
MLVAFISVIAMLNAAIESITGWFGGEGMTLELLFGFVFAPVAWLIGVDSSEVLTAGSFIGQKVILNEFVAFIDFVEAKAMLSDKTQVIITFALCGFANIASIAIQIGAIASMAPERRSDVASLGIKAVLAGTLANLMSACLAGLFFVL